MKKRGVSAIIGYVILIAIVITMSIIVYNWIKSYVPADALNCPEGVSVSITNYTCSGGKFSFTLKNTGTFNIAGYSIHAATSADQQIPAIDLSADFIEGTGTGKTYGGTYILLGDISSGINPISPSDQISSGFDYSDDPSFSGGKKIAKIEVTPVRNVVYDNKNSWASCGSARVVQNIVCQ